MLIGGWQDRQEMIGRLAKGGSPPPSGWRSAMHFFDYNTEHLGIGTLDAPEWRIDDPAQAYATRAAAARAGMWGNHGYEADYEIVYVDADGSSSAAPSVTSCGSTQCPRSMPSGR